MPNACFMARSRALAAHRLQGGSPHAVSQRTCRWVWPQDPSTSWSYDYGLFQQQINLTTVLILINTCSDESSKQIEGKARNNQQCRVDCTLFRGGADEVDKLMKKSSVTRRISKCLVKGCIDEMRSRFVSSTVFSTATSRSCHLFARAKIRNLLTVSTHRDSQTTPRPPTLPQMTAWYLIPKIMGLLDHV